MKQIILFDIDYTLINTNKLIAKAVSIIIKRKKNGKINKNLELPNHKSPIIKLLLKYYLTPANLKDCIYPDTFKILKLLKNEGVELGIFSEGNYNIQIQKLRVSKLLPYFNPDLIFIQKNKISILNKSILLLAKKSIDNTYIVDNKKNIITRASQIGIKGFLINRKLEKDLSHSNWVEIQNLSNIINHL